VKRRGADEVMEALEAEGVELVAGIPGTHNLELWDAMGASGSVRPVLVTDEQSASFLADGAWRASGRMAALALVPGAGLTHALSGVAEALLDNVPMLILACGIRTDTDRAFQLHEMDQVALAGPVTKAALRLGPDEDVGGAVRRACRLARAGAPGPVLLEIPAELMLGWHAARGGGGSDSAGPGVAGATAAGPSHASAPAPSPGSAAGGPAPGPGAPAEEDVARAAEILAGADRPLLYVGAGAAGAADLLPALAQRLEAPVSTTFQGKGVFPEAHPLWLWPGFGRTAPSFVREVAADCDATLALGCRFREVGTGSWSFEPPGPLVHVDIDPEALDRNFPAEVAAAADARAFVEALLDRLGAATAPRGGADPSSPGPAREPDRALRERIREGHEEVRREQLEPTGEEGVSPGLLLDVLQRALGPEAVYATDSGNGTFLAVEMLRLDAPRRFLAPVDYSCMGYSVPAAVGAALARPGAPVVALAGDGAFLMTGLELLTAAREGAAVAAFVLRDRELAQIAQFQQVALGRREASRVADYDLASLCRGVGVECLALETDDAIEATVRAAADRLAEGRPVAVDVAIDYSRPTFFTRGVVRTTFGRLSWPDRLRFVGRALWRRVGG